MHATNGQDSCPVKPRWHPLIPDRLIVVLPILVGLLWLSQRGHWFSFAQHKGWAVLIAVAVVLTAMVLMALGFLLCLLFRQRFQFSLRSLLVFTVTVALVCSWLAVEMKQAREQKESIKALGERTWIGYDWRHSGPKPQPPEPVWLRSLLGNDFFDTVVDIKSHVLTDAESRYLARMTRLDILWLNSMQVTDAGLQHLAGMTRLELLSLNGAQVTDAGLQHLAGMTRLESLRLNDVQVTDAGLQHLSGATQLRELELEDTHVTDEGVRNLRHALPDCWISN